MAVNQSQDRPPAAGPSRWRTILCYAAGSVLIGIGLLNLSSEWLDDRAAALINIVGGACLLPPVLRRIRHRIFWTQSPAAPVLFFFLVPFLAAAGRIPFPPSGSQLAQHRAETVTKVEGLLKEGKTWDARLELAQQRGGSSSDASTAALTRRIELAEKHEADTRAAASALEVVAASKRQDAERLSEQANEDAKKARADRDKRQHNAEGQALLTTISALQAEAHDPTSLLITGQTVIKETLADGTPILRVYVTYRGTNGFGAVVSEKAVLTMSSDGKRALGVQRVP